MQMQQTGEGSSGGRRTAIESFVIPAWTDGWRPDIQKTGAPPTSVYDILNFMWNPDMTLSKRKGYTQLADTTIAGLEIPDHVLAPRVYTTEGLFPQFSQQVLSFNRSNGEMFYQSLGKLWQEFKADTTGANLVDSTHSIGPASDTAINRFRVWPITAVTFGSKIYATTLRYGGFDSGTNQADATATGLWKTQDASKDSASLPIVYNVQTTTFARPAVHALDGTTGGFVRARTMLAKYARIFAANLHSFQTYRYPSRIYWCGTDGDPDQPEVWEALNYIDVGADDGQEVVRMLSFGDQILILKNQSIWSLVGTDDSTFALYQLHDALGSEATYASTVSENTAYFLDERTGVWAYDGAEFNNISDPIKDLLLDELNRDASYKSVMAWHRDKLYLSIPVGTGSDATNSVTYVFDTKLNAWTKYDYELLPHPFPFYSDYNIVGPTVSLSNELFSGMPVKGVFILDDGLSDNGNAIAAHITTPWINPGDLAEHHRLRRLELVTDEGDGDATIDIFRDLEFDVAKTTLTHSVAAGTQNYLSEYQSPDSFMWSWLCLRISQTSLTALNLFTVGFTTSTRPRPRGTLTKTGYVA